MGGYRFSAVSSRRYSVVVDAEPSPDGLQLQLDGFEGPLDLLLDLARRQQVDLARISVLDLVDQFLERGHGQAAAGLVVAADLVNLFQACVDVLERPDQRRPDVYQPPRSPLWTPIQALARMRAMLIGRAEDGDLLSFLPPVAADLNDRLLRIRGAVASTLIAALELARSGEACLCQDGAFGEVRVHPVNALSTKDRVPSRGVSTALQSRVSCSIRLPGAAG